MDFLILSTLARSKVHRIIISYDIACQWSKNLGVRMKAYPEHLRLDLVNKEVGYAVPKFHLPAHGVKCQSPFSFNYKRNVGRTCGEGIEQGWSHSNPLASSTKEMGTGDRALTLNEHWAGWNHGKKIGLGASLPSS